MNTVWFKTFNWLNGDGAKNAPSRPVDSDLSGAWVYAVPFRPFGDCSLNSINDYVATLTAIVLLNASSYPSHVADFIVSIVVNTVKRVLWCRAFSDMVKKFRKGIKAKFNTAPAIIFIGFVCRFLASVFGIVKNSILRCWRVVERIFNFLFVFLYTSTGLSGTIKQFEGENAFYRSTITTANPFMSRCSETNFAVITNYLKVSKTLVKQIFEVAVRRYIVCHFNHIPVIVTFKCKGVNPERCK